MPIPARSPRSRPYGAPACHLARAATWPITALRQPHQPVTRRAAAG